MKHSWAANFRRTQVMCGGLDPKSLEKNSRLFLISSARMTVDLRRQSRTMAPHEITRMQGLIDSHIIYFLESELEREILNQYAIFQAVKLRNYRRLEKDYSFFRILWRNILDFYYGTHDLYCHEELEAAEDY